MSKTHFNGPVVMNGGINAATVDPNLVSGSIFGNGGAYSIIETTVSTGEPGSPSGWAMGALPPVAGISNTTATTIATVNVPNIAVSGVALLLVRTACTGASHTYDSTRVGVYLLTVTRVPGAAAVGHLSSVVCAQIATSSGGHTLTFSLAVASVVGGVTATNTLPIQITNTPSDSGTTESQITVMWNNGLNGTSISAASGTGMTIHS